MNPTEILKALQAAELYQKYEGELLGAEWECTILREAVEYLAKAWQQTSMTDEKIDAVDALTEAIVKESGNDHTEATDGSGR